MVQPPTDDNVQALSAAAGLRLRYSALTEVLIQAARAYRSFPRSDVLEYLRSLDTERLAAFTAMNEAMNAANVGPFPWTSLEAITLMLEAEE